ncbi:MAG TPA: hypothetical protein VFQ53_24305 [Kofleriaceae bacterium]|nr:hypothetical protein [Kofleriaceae bacterium]
MCTALIEGLSFDALAILRGVPALHDYFDEPAAHSLAASGAGGAVVRRWPTASVAPARERRWFARTRH